MLAKARRMLGKARRVLGKARRMLGAARDTVDGRLHSRRRSRSIDVLKRILREEERPTFLFVCLGNVCRSPYAAWAFSRMMEDESGVEVEASSAGFIGPGRSPPETAVEAALERGIDHRTHVSTILTDERIRGADVIFVFDRRNLRRLGKMEAADTTTAFLLGDFDPRWAGKRAIVDPWGEPLEAFERTFARIDRCLETLREALDDDARKTAVNG